MKVIHIAGSSGSGKTTFIGELLAELGRMGPVATVKHLGHHRYSLEKGKDTTFFYDRGVSLSVGVDDEKAVITRRGGSLHDVLGILSDHGVGFALMEGFKTLPLPKIVIGSLETKHCLLRDPDIGQVIGSLGSFPDFYTCGGLAREITPNPEKSQTCVLLAFSGGILGLSGKKGGHLSHISAGEACAGIESWMAGTPGICGARLRLHPGTLFGGSKDLIHAVITATTIGEASISMKTGLDRLRSALRPSGFDLEGSV